MNNLLRCAGWTLFAICNLEDSRIILDPVENFNDWEVPMIRRFYTREVDRIFKRYKQKLIIITKKKLFDLKYLCP